MKAKLFFACMFLLICTSLAYAENNETDVLVTILEPSTIMLGDDEYGNDTIDDDGTVWATLTTDPLVESCEINWEVSWENIDKTITSINHSYPSYGLKTVYYRCYDNNNNVVNVSDSITIPDADEDNVIDLYDNCPTVYNPNQEDTDADRVGDACDNCVNDANPDQADCNDDGIGDECDAINPSAEEVCDNIDNDCDGAVDDGGDTLCDDNLFCNGNEVCQGELGCQAGTPVDCSINDLLEIATCNNNPDNNPFTWDYLVGFTSTCDEDLDVCTTGIADLTHACSIEQCNAECETDDDCEDNTCSETYNDYCDNKKLVEYDNDKIKDSTTVTDSCTNTCLADCTSTDCSVDCFAPVTNTYCVKDVCGAECAVDADCDDNGVHTTDICQSSCVCEHQFVNNDPTIDSYTPTDLNPSLDEGGNLTFSITASDLDGDALLYSWKLDGEEVSTTTSYTYSPGYEDSGLHVITVIVSDSFGSDSQQWDVNVNEAGEVFEQSLTIGWNTVTLTVHPYDTVVASVLSSIEGKYDNVWAEVNGEWLSYSPTVLPLMNTLTYLDETTTFYIEMNQAATLVVIGAPLNATS